ncbi:MAG: hypothetical protein IJJ33_05775 [Victivallales bacterium]|nr:hypothetical protein [Victivallales bacterium]
MNSLRLMAVVASASLLPVLAEGKPWLGHFQDLRAAVAKVEPESSEDYRLGETLMAEIRALAAKKRAAVPAPIISFESLSSAGRMWFTNHNYTDRQLFCSRDLWEGGPSQFQSASHRKTFEIFRQYGVNTFNVYAYGENFQRYLENLAKFQPGLKVIPTVTPPGMNGKLNPVNLKLVGESPFIYRLDGRPLFLCWGWLNIPKTREFIRELEALVGCPVAYIHSCGSISEYHDPFNAYIAGKGVAATVLLQWFDHLSELLECCAGIEYANRVTEADGRLCVRYYNEVIMPLFAAVCAQEQYNGRKLCGLEILTGYNNYRGRQRLSPDGTKTLFAYLNVARRFSLDILKCFEWDEYNEDSHFQPTVNKPMAYQRILKYWNDSNRRVPPTPNAGDDLSLPNLILSHVKQVVAGPDYELELLNVPDSDKAEPYTVQVDILDERGGTLHTETFAFDRAELREHTVRVPASVYIGADALVTRLVIRYGGRTRFVQEGLPFTVVRPTTLCDTTWYSTPLRNVLFPENSAVRFGQAKNPSGALPERVEVPVAAELAFGDALSSVEVVQNGRDTRFSYDPQDEFRQNDAERVNLILSFSHLEFLGPLKFEAEVKLANAPSALWYEYEKDPKYKYLNNVSVKHLEHSAGEGFRLGGGVSSWRNATVLSLKRAEFDGASFSISGRRTAGANAGEEFHWEIPLGRLSPAGVCSTVFADGFQVALEIPQRMDLLPLPVNGTTARFTATLHTGYPSGVYAVRAVSRTGKVWWSAPVTYRLPATGETQAVSVFHNQDGPYDLAVDSSRVPHVKYRFDPNIAGNVLTTSAGREFYGNLGGYDLVPTGYEGYHCSVYSIPYSFRLSGGKPYTLNQAGKQTADVGRLAVPQYETLADGAWCLNFTGQGEFIGFAPSVFPQRAGCTVKFEFLPLEVERDQVYFVHAEHAIAGFRLRTEDKRLAVDFHRRQAPGNDRENVKTFVTDLEPQEGQWNTVVFRYDLRNVTVELNGRQESFPCQGLSRWFAVAGFGGDGTKSKNGHVQFFKGRLKSFEVIHSAK